MKSVNQLFKKTFILSLLCIALMSFCHPVFTSVKAFNENAQGSIEFVKADGRSLIFEVKIPQIPAKGCVLRISNEKGEVMHEQRIYSPAFKQSYRIERADLNKINFEATGKKFRLTESFDLRVRVEEKMEVTKL